MVASDGEPTPGGLFDGVLARGEVRHHVTDGAWLQAMLDVEAALARAQARAGLVSRHIAEAIATACQADRFDPAQLGLDAAAGGTPAIPLVAALRAEVGGEAADWVHHGATSQDVVDSAAMLMAHRALGPLLTDLDAASRSLDELADTHRATPVAARTLLQHAQPTTFGLKAAGWLAGLDEARQRLHAVRTERLAIQLGGAGGTLAALGDHGTTVMAHLGDELGLVCPPLPWHTVRTRHAELAGALGEAAGVVGKIAGDLVRLAQTEVGEVTERADGTSQRGGSSALPHKRNPIASVCAVASAERAPGLVATLMAVGAHHEHERAAGAWHAEWQPLSELLRTTGSAMAWLVEALDRLVVDVEQMWANLARTGGVMLSERIVNAIAPAVGKGAAQRLVREASLAAADQGRDLAEVLADRADVTAHVDRARLAELCDPLTFLGSAETFIDRARHAHRHHGHRPDEREEAP